MPSIVHGLRVAVRYGAAVGALTLGGCVIDLAVNAEAGVSCAASADCPGGMICNPNTALCVEAERADTSIPTATLALSPAVGTLATSVSIDVAAAEALRATPVVEVRGPGGTFVATALGQEGNLHRFVFQPSLVGLATDGAADGAYAISATFRDLAGNPGAANGVFFELDTLAPALLAEASTVTLEAGPERRLDRVAAILGTAVLPRLVSSGATVLVTALWSESFADATSQTSAQILGSPPTPLTLVAEAGAALIFEGVLPNTPSSGPALVEVSATDEAGNTATTVLDGSDQAFAVDITPPNAPVTTGTFDIVFTRQPWGNVAGEGPAMRVSGAPGSVEGSAFLLAYGSAAEAATSSAAPLGAARAGTDGAFGPMHLSAADRREVWLTVLDGAGNLAPPTRVDGVEWIATLAGRLPGSTFENPNGLAAAPYFSPSLDQPGSIELPGEDVATHSCLSGCGASGALSTSGQGAWERRWLVDVGVASFTPRQDMAVGWDEGRGYAVFFGGGFLPDTDGRVWIWQNGAIADGPTFSGPATRSGATLTYHAALGTLVLFGGATLDSSDCDDAGTGYVCNDIWIFDRERHWTQLAVGGPPPPGRRDPAVGYHRARQSLVIHGGIDGAGYALTDAYELTCSPGCVWSEITGFTPGPRSKHAAVYDAINEQLLVYGGFSNSSECEGDDPYCDGMWALNVEGEWNLVTSDLAARHSHSLVVDPGRGEILLWGLHADAVFNTPQQTCESPWAWRDNQKWSCAPPAAPFGVLGVGEREDTLAFADVGTGQIIITGPKERDVVWTWEDAALERPAQIATFAFGVAAGTPTPVHRFDFGPAETPIAAGDSLISDENAVGENPGWLYGQGNCGSGPELVTANTPDVTDRRLATAAIMWAAGQGSPPKCTFHAPIENGRYQVVVTLGRPGTTSTHGVALEPGPDQVELSVGTRPGRPFARVGALVDVDDGALTVEPLVTSTTLAYLEIYPAPRVEEVSIEWSAGGSGDRFSGYQAALLHDSSNIGSNLDVTVPLTEMQGRVVAGDWQLVVHYDPGQSLAPSSTGTVTRLCIDAGTSSHCVAPGQTVPWGKTTVLDFSVPVLATTGDPVARLQINGAATAAYTAELRALPTSAGQVDGAKLLVWNGHAWQEVARNDVPNGSTSAVLSATSTTPLAASSWFFGPSSLLGLAVAPVGVNGRIPEYATATSDGIQATVRYLISAQP